MVGITATEYFCPQDGLQALKDVQEALTQGPGVATVPSQWGSNTASDRSGSAKGNTKSGALRRRPPCRNFGGDPRSQELAGRIVERSARISALLREQLSDIAEFDQAEGWRGDGAVSMIAWVTAQCGVSTSTARQWVRSALNLESLPCLAEGLASGELSLDLVEPLAEVASPSSDAALREASAHWSVRQARELAAWHRAREEAEAEARAAAEARRRCGDDELDEGEAASALAENLRPGNSSGGHCASTTRGSRCGFAFTKDDYAVVKSSVAAIVAAEQREREKLDGRRRIAVGYVPYDKRLYDELMHLFERGGRIGVGENGRSGAGCDRSRPRVVVHAPLELLVGCSDDAVAEIAGVGPVPGRSGAAAGLRRQRGSGRGGSGRVRS